ncbi:MAG: helix-turn-helix transcriptional regulator [Thermoplasmata archaeon]|nr:helix-turn-helix transcriptional regulator [Thermoplasmata archaeon]
MASARSAQVSPKLPSDRPSVRTGSGGCQVEELFVMLGRPHMLKILHTFEESDGAPLRFNELQGRLKISPKTLAQRLRTLVEAGFLARRAYNEIPPRVEYQPTAKVSELADLFHALEQWSRRNNLHAVAMVSTVGRVPA